MATQVQQRRGTTAEHSTFTGGVGEVTVDTDKDTAVVHDGTTAGGRPLMREDMSNVPAGTVTSTMIANDTIVNADVNASAAIAGTKISPDFGSQNALTTGTSTAASFIPTSSSIPTNGVYLPAANTVALATNGTKRLVVDANGSIAFGGDTLAQYSLFIARNITGAITSYGTVAQGVVQSDVTNSASYYNTFAGTQATTFTLGALNHFQAQQVTFGAGSTVTNQYGFRVANNLTGATNNYGFYGSLASGTNRWNFYAAGTADSYFASNNFIWANGGSEKARIDSSGRLGIGVSGPTVPLHLVSASSDPVLIKTTGSNTYNSLILENDTGSKVAVGIGGSTVGGAVQDAGYVGTISNKPFYINTNNTQRVAVTAAGLVGIGTSSPTSTFHVGAGLASTQSPVTYLSAENGSATVACEIRQGRFDKDVLVLSTNQSLSANLFNAIENGTSRFVITGAGTVGLGTASPAYQLHLSSSAAANYLQIDGPSSKSYFGYQSGATEIYAITNTGAAAPLLFYRGSTESARLDSSGRLLVGTSSTSANSTVVLQGASSDATAGSIFRMNRGVATPADGAGLGTIVFGDSSSSDGAYISGLRDGGTWSGSSKPTRLVFSLTADGAASPTERMRIDSNGFASYAGAIGRGAPVTKTGAFTVGIAENWLICNGTASITVTLPTASAWTGREIMLKTIAAFTVVSASSNVVPLATATAGTAILAATAGKYATLVSNGTNWVIMQAN